MQQQEIATVSAPFWRRWTFWLVAVVIVGLAGAWAFAFWYDANRPPPEPLDATSVRAAAAVCHDARIRLRALPQVDPKAPAATERITRIRREDAILTTVVDRLEAIHPSDSEGAAALHGFATDWKNLVTARERYADELEAGGRPKLVIPVDPSSAPISIRMTDYAQIHRLNDCTTDSLQGEVVEGQRSYG